MTDEQEPIEPNKEVAAKPVAKKAAKKAAKNVISISRHNYWTARLKINYD